MTTQPEHFTFRTSGGDDIAIDSKDLVAVVPDQDGSASTIVYVEQDPTDPTKLPTIIFKEESTFNSDVPNPQAFTTPEETHVLISTGSGKREAERFYNESTKPILSALFPQQSEKFHIHTTESESTILDLTNNVFFPIANAGRPLRIILLSGDGGIIDLVNGLSSQPLSASYIPPQVVLLPLGTANALYHSIVAGRENTWGLQALTSNEYESLPIFTASFSPGSRILADEARKELELPKDPETGHQVLHGTVVGSWGMHASLVADSDTTEYRKFGIDRFKMAAKEALYPADGSPPHPYKAKVSVLKGDSWEDLPAEEHMYVLATMVSNLEKPFTISPSTKPLDGSLHLIHFGPASGDEAMRIMGLAYQGGKHVDDPSVRYEAIDGLRIQFEGREEDARWRRICIDGKIVRVDKDGWVELRKESRRVLEIASV
ncbi:hypothetical protein BU24DRAFT_422550 [Aaosphaeria arxii CBS 175.79]|uniref:DAGKc domain-containing protein n=1 Tax=Aaosphaeria arxii CBS 175.79 TaxID=1450172 RepID=A0A6A5XU73_9PLEO|nr:uncharacterized protein BU24DRAFT_422550 [Aaosphaeria arxii CBS 175.79]KAF2016200.1 hypothetical protein BU24DRAFT_422550 [Aaosphaeria arxii CBS 175.79]